MRGRQMYVEEVKRVHRVSTRKDKFRERERYRRSFWGTVFLELVLEKMSEEEFDFENEEEKQQETKRPGKGSHSSWRREQENESFTGNFPNGRKRAFWNASGYCFGHRVIFWRSRHDRSVF